jgi:AraC-like DNA-binding protein
MDFQKKRRIRFNTFKHYLDYCINLGFKKEELLKAIGLDEVVLKKEPLYIPLEHLERLVLYIENKVDDPFWALDQALKDSGGPSVLVVALIMSVSENLEEAIATSCRYRIVNGDIGDTLIVEEKENYISLKFKCIPNNSRFLNLVVEYRSAWWIQFIKSMLGNDINYLKYVCFEHELKNFKVQEWFSNLSECPVYFGWNENAIVISKEALKIPFKTADRDLYVSLEKYIINLIDQFNSEDKITEVVKSLILYQLNRGPVSREKIAEMLGFNVRTLTRKLKAEGTTYGLILEEIRIENAKEYLIGTQHSILYIAKVLGFFTSSAFITWFKSLTGVTPKKFRDTHKETLKIG